MTGTMRMCQVCGTRPPAMREIPCCFGCWPGGPVTPPPCRKCGSSEDYYTSGLCARCHTRAPGQKSQTWKTAGGKVVVDSCPDCCGWGVTRTYGWLCPGCKAWRERNPAGTCTGCGRVIAVGADGACRLCRKQRSIIAHRDGIRIDHVSLAEANKGGQQLFFAIGGMFHQEGLGRQPYVKKTVPPDMTLLRPVSYRQLVLLDWPRDLRAGLRNGFLPPPDPALEAAFHQFVREHAGRYGWKPGKAETIQRAIRIMLGIQDTPGAPIRRSDVALLSRIKHSAAVVADVLAEAGMLEEDRTPAVVRWFEASITGLPAPMCHELSIWFDLMRNGTDVPPRSLPRTDTTITSQLRWALPALQHWAAAGHQSLREVGRDDVLAVLPSSGMPRTVMRQALRSVFRILKGRKLVFANPTARISAPPPVRQVPAAVDLEALRAELDSADPAVLAALLAFHAVRICQLAALRLTDLHDGRLHIGDQVIPLADPVRQRVARYLDWRQQAWPDTVNPYLLVHVRNTGNTRHVTPWWIRKQLSMSPQAIRLDRIFDEAQATGGDLRALCDLFGLSIAGAYRYTSVLDHVEYPDPGKPR
jgi:site-specific recombinase XerC